MADEPTDLGLFLLRDIRAKLDEHDKCFDARDRRFDAQEKRFDTLERMIRGWQETTATSLGFAAHADMRTETMSYDIEAIKDRLSQIEGR